MSIVSGFMIDKIDKLPKTSRKKLSQKNIVLINKTNPAACLVEYVNKV
jgi:hypothetical protein